MHTLGSRSTCEEVAAAFPEGVQEVASMTIAVTGCNTGIGLETAKHLAKLGAHVVMACRSEAKAQQAKAEIEKFAKIDHGCTKVVSIIVVDLSDLQSVGNFVNTFKERSVSEGWPPLRMLVLNAGLILSKAERSAQGYEKTFATNHLGHMALTEGLLPELRKNQPSRVIVVSSGSHYGPLAERNVEFKENLRKTFVNPVFPEDEPFSTMQAMKLYGSSKLCNVLFAQKIHERENSNGVAACSLHPGTFIPTDITRSSNGWIQFLVRNILSWFTKSVNQGASTTIYCALLPQGSLQGQYFDNCSTKAKSRRATDSAAESLWQVSEELILKARI